MKGTVVKSTGSWYAVRLEDGKEIEARIRGKFRLDGKRLTNPVAVGDEVVLKLEEDGEFATITEILERRNYVVRQSPRKKHQLHLLATNIDQALLIVTIIAPHLKQSFIDRFLLMTEPHDIPVIIAINKRDLWGEEEEMMFEGLKYIYEDIGYDVIGISAFDREDVERVKELLKGKLTLVSGQSGVGKSTLLNSIDPELGLKTQELSEYTGKGMHTTTFAEMFDLPFDGRIIDTPGIKSLSFNNLEPQDVAHNFREIFEKSSECKFYDCFHRNEPKCAVKKAVETGEISELRYMNYLTILDEIEEQNYWERRTDM